ncbi:MAG TPA: outer membrane beta-barrel protein [Cyclobacteriaceae bacterium]|nr:outer membrane beta-barrel protein [Cyclobacteriaceae bacterium]
MNKLTWLTLLLMLCLAVTSFGQGEETQPYISKGQWMLGGTVSLRTPDDFQTANFSISPMGAYFIGNRWTLGVELGYSVSEIDALNPITGETYTQTLSSLSTTPFARYYFGVKKFAPFVEGGYQMNWYYGEGEKIGDNQRYKVGAGLNYFVSPSLALEGKVSYTYPVNDESAYKPIGLGIGLQFFFSRNQNAIAKESNETFLAKGSWMLGGDINLEFSENEYQTHRINPMVGYFLTNKFATGVAIGYAYSGGEYNSIEALSAAPFIRYYFAIGRFAPFAGVAAGLAHSKFEYYDGDEWQGSTDNSFSYQAGVGFNYFITKNVALESGLSYFRNQNIDQGSLALTAGLKFFIPRK